MVELKDMSISPLTITKVRPKATTPAMDMLRKILKKLVTLKKFVLTKIITIIIARINQISVSLLLENSISYGFLFIFFILLSSSISHTSQI